MGKKKFSYDYPRPALAVDVILVSRESRPRVLLIQRKKDPFAGMWAFPGGYVEEDESLLAAAKRELSEETGVAVTELEQLYAAGDPGRDPRGWTISVVFLGRVNANEIQAVAADDAAAVGWHFLDAPPPLAFDHGQLIQRARTRLLDRNPE